MTGDSPRHAPSVGSADLDATQRGRGDGLPSSRSALKVRDIMTTVLRTASPGTPLPDLVDIMVTHRVSGVPIIDGDARLAGIVTEADVVSKAAFGGTHRKVLDVLADLWHGRDGHWIAKAKALTAGDVMTTEIDVAAPGESVRSAARHMIEAGVKRLPVVDGDRLVGIVSRADVIRAMHRTDAELAGEVRAVLADPMRTPEDVDVTVDVGDGVVTLRGTVRYPMDLPVLSEIVWNNPAVVGVRNEATPREPDPQPWPPIVPSY